MRREGPIIVGAILGLIVILANFLNNASLTSLRSTLDNWNNIALAFATFLGVVSLSRVHIRKITQNKSDSFFSWVTLLSLFPYMIYGIFFCKSAGDTKFTWIFRTSVSPMGATIFSLLAFYIASAAFRAFRVRNAEATVLLICAVFTMMGNVSIGKQIWTRIPDVRNWIISWPNTAGMRGIQIGATLGGISTSLRVLLGLERSHLGGE